MRLRFQFRLRTLLLVVLVSGPASAFLIKSGLTTYEQRSFGDAVIALGGRVEIHSVSTLSSPSKWHWFTGQTRLGAYFWDAPLTDSQLRSLAERPDRHTMARLFLDRSNVTDAGLACLPRFSQLEAVSVGDCDVSDEGIESLKRIGTLKELVVRGTKVTASGVRELKKTLPDCLVYRTDSLDPE